jgi:N-acetylglutamate synthase
MKSKEITIREFTMDDYAQVTALWTQAGIHYRPNGRESRARMDKELQGGQAIFLVAEADKKVVGVVLGTHDGRKGWINRLPVANDFRCQNIASKLVAGVESRLKAVGIDITACLIEPENTASKSFFSKLGFTKAPVEYFSKRQSTDA